MQRPNFDPAHPPTITPALRDAVQAYLLARAYTQTIRPTVEAYKRATLIASNVRYDTRYEERRGREFITELADAWMGRDEDTDRYFRALDDAHAAHGFDVPAGYCPLLIAEYDEIKARWAICEESEYISGLKRADITINLDRFREYTELMVGLVLTLCPDITTETVLADV